MATTFETGDQSAASETVYCWKLSPAAQAHICYCNYRNCGPDRPSHRTSRDPPERGFYKLRRANKTDHLCQSWQYCHMFMKFKQCTFVAASLLQYARAIHWWPCWCSIQGQKCCQFLLLAWLLLLAGRLHCFKSCTMMILKLCNVTPFARCSFEHHCSWHQALLNHLLLLLPAITYKMSADSRLTVVTVCTV